ncbi:MAG: hypothetical protein ABW173_10440 [Sphingomonas sp.]
MFPIGGRAGGDATGGEIARNLLLSTVGNIGGGAAVALALGHGHDGSDA